MKKLLTYWGDFAFVPLYFMATAFSFPTLYNNALLTIGYCVIFLFAALAMLILNFSRKKYNVRDCAYLVLGLLALLFVLIIFVFMHTMGSEYLMGESLRADTFWWLQSRTLDSFEFAAISLYSARIAIWLFKKWQTKRTPPAEPEEPQE